LEEQKAMTEAKMKKAITNSIVVVVLLLGLAAGLPLQAQRGGSGGSKQPPPDPAIAYTSGGWLYVMNADGSNRTVVWRRGSSAAPDWSPDAKRLVFVYQPDSQSQAGIYLINLDGSGLCKLAPVVLNYWLYQVSPVWSPVPMVDGSEWIIYADHSHETHSQDLFAVRADCRNAGTPINLTNTSAESEGFPSWSRLSNRLAASLANDQFPCGMVVLYDISLAVRENGIRVPGLSNRQTVQDLGLFTEMQQTGTPAWGKNDDRLALIAVLDPYLWGDIWMIDPTADGTFQLTDTPAGTTIGAGEAFPDWAPSGTELVYFTSGYAPLAIWKLSLNIVDGKETWVRTKLVDTGLSANPPKWRKRDP
jgi:Tol biopolymer transport system component